MSTALASDHLMVLFPDADTPFEDELDALNRLLPYHVFQHPKIDLDSMRGIKGKAKATEADLLREEIRGEQRMAFLRRVSLLLMTFRSNVAQIHDLLWNVTSACGFCRVGLEKQGQERIK